MASPPKIVIVGGGFSGAYFARQFERRLRPGEAEVVLIDRHNYFIFFPLLIEAGTGALQPSHAVVGIRSMLRTSHFLMADVSAVDLAGRTITACVGRETGEPETRTIPFDHLVMATGSVTKFPPVPGLREHAYEVKSLAQAVALRDRVVQLLEQADATTDDTLRRRLLHMVVVGGSYTGVEVAGEFHEYMREVARRYRGLDPSMVRVTLFDTNERILTTLDERLSHWAADRLRHRGVDLRLKDTVTEVRADGVTLRSGGTLDCCTVIWAAGIAPSPLANTPGLPLERGWIVCDPDGRVKGTTNVWAIGDVGMNPDPTGKPYPATAQHAIQEGRQAADNLLHVLRNEPTAPIRIVNKGTLAAFGRRDAVAKVFGIRIAGVLAWLMWRGVYLMKVPGLRRSFQVLFDWIAVMLLDRDYVELGIHRSLRAGPAVATASAASPTPTNVTPSANGAGTPRHESLPPAAATPPAP